MKLFNMVSEVGKTCNLIEAAQWIRLVICKLAQS
jgi:hypothetical protein